MLKKLGIVKSKTKGYKAFNSIDPNFVNNKMKPHEYVNYYWNNFKKINPTSSNSLNGNFFELVIASLLVKEGIMPLYLQAKIAFVPNVDYDAVVYTNENGPIVFSLKTSLRERYKQADLEAVALKYVHRKAKSYLLTMNKDEHGAVSEKIKSGDILGIDKAILTIDSEFDKFIDELKTNSFIEPGSIEIITSATLITSDKLKKFV